MWPTLFRLWLDHDQQWRVESAGSRRPSQSFAELPEAVAFAKRACAGAPAIVELRIGALYVAIRQERRWPNPICTNSMV